MDRRTVLVASGALAALPQCASRASLSFATDHVVLRNSRGGATDRCCGPSPNPGSRTVGQQSSSKASPGAWGGAP